MSGRNIARLIAAVGGVAAGGLLLHLVGTGTGIGLWLHAPPVLHIASIAQESPHSPGPTPAHMPVQNPTVTPPGQPAQFPTSPGPTPTTPAQPPTEPTEPTPATPTTPPTTAPPPTTQQQPPPSVSASVNPNSGTHCNTVTFTFTAIVTYTGSTSSVFAYTWVHSDGTIDPQQSVSFGGPGTQQVRTTWLANVTPATPANGWAELEILTPPAVFSNQATFNVSCFV